MSRKRKLVTAAGTIGCALAIGWVMQATVEPPKGTITYSPAPIEKAPLVPAQTAPAGPMKSAELPALPESPDLPDLPITALRLTSVAAPLPAISDLTRSLLSDASYAPDVAPTMPDEPLTPYLGCEITASARTVPLASVAIDVTAPCDGNTRVTVHHNGMMFTETTSAGGDLHLTVPAMSETAVFVIEFDNDRGVVATAEVPELAGIDRIALQWTGDAGFQVHAREFGANYGGEGHVWSGATSSRNGGAFVRLGDASALGAKVVEVYTFPTDTATRSGTVDLTVEAEVTAANCGRDLAAQSIELRGTSLRTQDLVLSMPECSAVGDFLVLNNLVDDLKIAAR